MLLENSLKKYKETSEAIKQMVGLVGLTVTIIFTFFILNIFFGEIKESDTIAESVKTEEINKVITSLPRGRLNFYESTEGHQLSLSEYEAVCKNTKIVTQRSVMGANIASRYALPAGGVTLAGKGLYDLTAAFGNEADYQEPGQMPLS